MKLVVACDVVDSGELERLVSATGSLSEVAAFKLGALAGLSIGLRSAARIVRQHSDKLIIYDHQKAGNDIPDITQRLVDLAGRSGVQGVIAFPFAGPLVLRSFVKACREANVMPIVGSRMTHDQFDAADQGFIQAADAARILDMAAELGVHDFVLPGNQPVTAREHADRLRAIVETPRFWCPGIGRQGGAPRELREALDPSTVFAIVGSSLYLSDDPKRTAVELSSVI